MPEATVTIENLTRSVFHIPVYKDKVLPARPPLRPEAVTVPEQVAVLTIGDKLDTDENVIAALINSEGTAGRDPAVIRATWVRDEVLTPNPIASLSVEDWAEIGHVGRNWMRELAHAGQVRLTGDPGEEALAKLARARK